MVQAENIHLASYPLSYPFHMGHNHSLLQDMVENNHLSGSNITTDDKKPLMVKYSGLAKAPSLDVSAVQAVRYQKSAEGKRFLCQCPVFILQLLSKLGEWTRWTSDLIQ